MKHVGALFFFVLLVLGKMVNGLQAWNASGMSSGQDVAGALLVGLTLIHSAAAKGALCLDGTVPGYHLHRGYGSGANSWLIHLEGGGWCKNVRMCTFLKATRHGSSRHMEEWLSFTGILSNRAEENPDFYNWNRVKVRYCDGASFSGEGHDKLYFVGAVGVSYCTSKKGHGLFFRGQRIWLAAMEELLLRGMRHANQALLTGCSAGGLSTILHCDEFRALFRSNTKVKCFADAGFFLDVADVAGARALRFMFQSVVRLQGVEKNLPQACISQMNPTLCFFPQNVIEHIKTPIFLLNSAYDLWQVMDGIAPSSADPHGHWKLCKESHANCTSAQQAVLQGFRNQMLNAVKSFSTSRKNGLFINSCFVHCQSECQSTWFANGSPTLRNKRIAEAVGDWFFDRSTFQAIDCPYPCDNSCRHQN